MSSYSAFVSYSREDSEFALRLAQDLKKAGAHIWLDQMDIQPGYPWDNAIEDALMDSPLMLLILSPASAKSDNVRNEISFALEQGKTVIPVLYMSCVVPLRLQRTQRIDFRSDYARGLTSLLEQLRVSRPDPSVIQKVVEDDAQRQAAWRARELQAQKLAERVETQQAVGPIPLSTPTMAEKQQLPVPLPPPASSNSVPLSQSPEAGSHVSNPAIPLDRKRLGKRARRYLIASIASFAMFLLFAFSNAGVLALTFLLLVIFTGIQYLRARRRFEATQAEAVMVQAP